MESPGGWTTQEQARYLRELKPYFIASVLLILAGAACGVASSIHIPAFSGPFGESLREFAKGFLGLPRPYLALAIFLNNSLKTLAVIVAGVLGGILPLVFLLGNGFALGIVFYASLASKGLPTFFLSITPHGLFELPAILLGSSIGLMLGVRAIKRLFGNGGTTIGEDFRRGLRFYVVVIMPLLLLAAFIEAFVTASLASK
ncbi:MAG TPA: stage II sporulation protein M [Candidatus Binatia bacterium]|jgi:stage II sporulation protein M